MTARRGPPENDRLAAWVKAHSGQPTLYGEQCLHHPPIREMIRGQIRQAQIDDMGHFYSRQWLHNFYERYDIETCGKKGPLRVLTPELVLAQARARWRVYYRAKMSTPEGREYLRAKQREKERRRRERLRQSGTADGETIPPENQEC